MERNYPSIAGPCPFVTVSDFSHSTFMNLCKVMVWVIEKNITRAQPLFLLADCSTNMFHNTMLSAVREMGIWKGTQIKNQCSESHPQHSTLYSCSEYSHASLTSWGINGLSRLAVKGGGFVVLSAYTFGLLVFAPFLWSLSLFLGQIYAVAFPFPQQWKKEFRYRLVSNYFCLYSLREIM